MTRDAKIAAEGAFEPREKGTNDPAVQKLLSTLLICYVLQKMLC